MDVLEAIRQRHATRSYAATPVDEATVRKLLDAAIHAPSANNLQPWSFVVIQDRKLLKEISEEAKAALAQDPHWKSHLPLTDPAFDIFYGAGTLVVICSRRDGFAPVGDCYLAGENLMLAATDLGLATCPIGLARDVLQAPAMKRRLGVPPDEQPVLPIAVGHAAGAMPAHPRAAPKIHSWKH